MNKEIYTFIKKIMPVNPSRKTLRFPAELEKILEAESKKDNVDVVELMRNIMILYCLPDILDSELKKEAMEWITTQGKDCIEIHFGDKIAKLHKIKELADFAIEETEKIQQKFLAAEVEGLNNINNKISKEL